MVDDLDETGDILTSISWITKMITLGRHLTLSTKRTRLLRIKNNNNPVGLYPADGGQQPQHQLQRVRCISTRAALRLLGLPRDQNEHSLTIKQLRHAYFAAAKRCHPDIVKNNNNGDETTKEDDGHADFLELTAAYEHLSRTVTHGDEWGDDFVVSADEEADFRAACEMSLGVSAEIVEECKRSPIFRRWLSGRTDAAHTWRDFLTKNGGLAPKLQPVAGELPSGQGIGAGSPSRLHSRRRRR